MEVVIAPVNNRVQASEHNQQNDIEAEEGAQVDEHLHQHTHQEGQAINNPQIEESFDQHDDSYYHHQNLALWLQDVGLGPLYDNVGNTDPDVALVHHVPGILKILGTLLYQLQAVVEHGIHDTG